MNCAKLQAIKVDFLTIFRTHIRVLRYLKVTDRNPFWLFKQISKKDILVTFNELLFIYILYISIEGIISKKKKRNGSIKLNIDSRDVKRCSKTRIRRIQTKYHFFFKSQFQKNIRFASFSKYC